MFGRQELDQRSIRLVDNIYNNFRTHPNYISYQFKRYSELGCEVLEVLKDGRHVNMYRFYPKAYNGELGSIAIYGIQLEQHFRTIDSTKNIFGFKVDDVELVSNNTAESFVDITLY